IIATLGAAHTFSEVGLFFSKMAVVTVGGAYAVLAYMAQQAVETYGWLRPGEMLDGLGMAETTPGPLIMVVQFVGFMAAYRDPGSLPPLLAGTLGGLLATWTTFVPCFLWIGLGAPFIERLRDNKPLSGANDRRRSHDCCRRCPTTGDPGRYRWDAARGGTARFRVHADRRRPGQRMEGGRRSDRGGAEGDRANQSGPNRLPLSARGLS